MRKAIKESDWKLLRKRLPEWQEEHMEKLLKGYAELLDADISASDRFWKLSEHMERDKRSAGVVIRDLSRSNAVANILNLLDDGVIGMEDLSGFSDEVLNAAKWTLDSQRGPRGTEKKRYDR